MYAREDVRLYPQSVHLQVNLGDVLLMLGELGECASVLEAARRVAAEDPEVKKLAGDLALARGDAKEAERWYREAIRPVKAENIPARTAQAQILARCRIVNLLLAARRPAEELDALVDEGEDSNVLMLFGRSLEQAGRRAEAERCLRRALEANPEYPGCANALPARSC